jgi:uncharacterized protein (DUF39 family)
MRISKTLLPIFCIVLTFLVSCDFGNPGEEIHLIDKYYTGWADLKTNQSIYIKDNAESNYGQTIVSGYVIAVGNNTQYIVAKQTSNFSDTTFHIIDTKGYYHTNTDNNNYWEFSTENEFNKRREKLNITEIKFDKTF